MDKGTDWSLFGGDKIFRENPAVNESNINSILLTVGASTVTHTSKQIDGWDFQSSYEIAGGSVHGDFNFYQIMLDARRYQPLWDFMNLNLRARAGASNGILPIQRTFELGGISTLPGYRFKEFTGSHILLGNVELIINSNFVRKSRGWASWLLNNVNIILFTDFGVTNTSSYLITRDYSSGAMDASFSDGFSSLTHNQVKTDAGIAIGSADGDFRLGMAWGLDRGRTPNFILRFTRPF
jgi:outer membrane protein assembly factor BamA